MLVQAGQGLKVLSNKNPVVREELIQVVEPKKKKKVQVGGFNAHLNAY